MSPLRSKFISYLQLRGLTDATIRNYVQAIKQFQDWLGKSPVHMTREFARQYLDFLKNTKKLAPRTINIHIYALKRVSWTRLLAYIHQSINPVLSAQQRYALLSKPHPASRLRPLS